MEQSRAHASLKTPAPIMTKGLAVDYIIDFVTLAVTVCEDCRLLQYGFHCTHHASGARVPSPVRGSAEIPQVRVAGRAIGAGDVLWLMHNAG